MWAIEHDLEPCMLSFSSSIMHQNEWFQVCFFQKLFGRGHPQTPPPFFLGFCALSTRLCPRFFFAPLFLASPSTFDWRTWFWPYVNHRGYHCQSHLPSSVAITHLVVAINFQWSCIFKSITIVLFLKNKRELVSFMLVLRWLLGITKKNTIMWENNNKMSEKIQLTKCVEKKLNGEYVVQQCYFPT